MRALPALLLLALPLTACGGESSSAPDCADVWKEGKTLPKSYDGCMDGDTLVAKISQTCPKDSKQPGVEYVSYNDEAWAIPGQKVVTKAGDLARICY